MLHLHSSKLFIVVLAVLILMTSACIAPAATNYAVSNIVYMFDATDPASIVTVSFDLDKPAEIVKVSLSNFSSLSQCESANSFTHWTCQLDGVQISDDMHLRVVVEK